MSKSKEWRRVVEFEIPYEDFCHGKMKAYCSRYGMNAYWAGKHWSKRKEDADLVHAITKSALNRAAVPYKPFDKPVSISFWHNDRMDIDNHAAVEKMITDALKDRVLHHDGRRWVKEKHVYYHDRDCIRVRLEELP